MWCNRKCFSSPYVMLTHTPDYLAKHINIYENYGNTRFTAPAARVIHVKTHTPLGYLGQVPDKCLYVSCTHLTASTR